MLLCVATFGFWVWFNAFACGMSPNGCSSFRLHWEDTEALSFFIPPFIAGCLLAATGAAFIFAERSKDAGKPKE